MTTFPSSPIFLNPIALLVVERVYSKKDIFYSKETQIEVLPGKRTDKPTGL